MAWLLAGFEGKVSLKPQEVEFSPRLQRSACSAVEVINSI
nr:hypothetical protein CDS [Bradyrhizobium sp.]